MFACKNKKNVNFWASKSWLDKWIQVTYLLTLKTCHYTNSQKKDNQFISALKRRNSSGVAKSKTEQAKEFNGQFTNVFSKTLESEVPLLEKSAQPMSDIHISNEGTVYYKSDDMLKSLKGFGTWWTSS